MIDERLVEEAKRARANSYAPYSKYFVGAAVLGIDGEIYSGCNVENGSFGLTICAERSAISRMVGGGCRRIVAVALCTANLGLPCGMCLQMILEFAPIPAEVRVILRDDAGRGKVFTMAELLPHGFSLVKP